MTTILEPAREVPVARDVDVAVVGGGPAGFAAAVAAARNGARTVLVERFGYLGGTATASLMACINGFRNQVEPDVTQTVRGIAEEVILAMKASGGLGGSPYTQRPFPDEPGRLAYSYAVDPEVLKVVLLRICRDAGVDLMLHAWFADAIVRDGAVRGVVLEDKSGRRAVLSRIVVDASGDGEVAARAGVPFREVEPGGGLPRLDEGLMYRIQFGDTRPEGVFACDFGDSAVVWGPAPKPADATDADALSRAEVEARLAVLEDFTGRQERHPELAGARVVETPPLLGIRQTRFIEGEYRLTADDALSGRRFDDGIAVSSCPIIHCYGYRRYLEHEGYDIPYRCLVPKVVEGLLVAGRCISSDQEPYESHRAMAPMMAVGQAAGAAAALCGRLGVQPRDLDAALLRETLTGQGAVVTLP